MIKVYWASSLHSKEIRDTNELYAKELESYGYEVLLPQRHGVWEKMFAELKEAEPHISDVECIHRVKQKCIDMDMIDLEMCDICIIYCPRIPSEGAIFEAAYCFAKGKPVYIFCPDDDIFNNINLMLTYSFKHIYKLDEMYTEYVTIMASRPTVLLLLNGGVNSTILLAYYLNKGYNVNTISVNYEQARTVKSLYAEQIAHYYKVSYKYIDLYNILKTIMNIHKNDYEMDISIRNTLMFLVIASIAKSNNINTIAYAANEKPIEFFNAINTVMNMYDLKVETPFLNYKKVDIISLGLYLGVDFNTIYSCYRGGKKPCGKCTACIEREQILKEVELL